MSYPIKIFCDFVSFDLNCSQQIELYVNKIPTAPKSNDVLRFVYLIEPNDIQDERNRAIFFYKKTYDILLTHDDFLLQRISDAHLLEFGSCWVKNYVSTQKDFAVSFVCGGKMITQGHMLRRAIWENENEIASIKKNFYISGNFSGNLTNPKNYPTLGDDKKVLFNSQFHIGIENSRQKNFFTEKLIDAIYTKTIPIYYGCDNISDWFDTRGLILVNSLEETIDAVRNLKEDTYDQMLPYVEENYVKSLRFVDFSAHVKKKIVEIVEKLKI